MNFFWNSLYTGFLKLQNSLEGPEIQLGIDLARKPPERFVFTKAAEKWKENLREIGGIGVQREPFTSGIQVHKLHQFKVQELHCHSQSLRQLVRLVADTFGASFSFLFVPLQHSIHFIKTFFH